MGEGEFCWHLTVSRMSRNLCISASCHPALERLDLMPPRDLQQEKGTAVILLTGAPDDAGMQRNVWCSSTPISRRGARQHRRREAAPSLRTSCSSGTA